jgi:hypothetical protein
MLFLSISQLKPGMILATDVTDTAGRLLLSKGQPIAPKHLNIFKMWGVPEVQVKNTDGDEPEAYTHGGPGSHAAGGRGA